MKLASATPTRLPPAMAAAGTEGDEILYCEVDTNRSKELRDAWGFFRDRRPEAYAEVTAP